MKRILLLCCVLLSAIVISTAQTEGTKLPAVDKSPMDVSYYPDNYPVLKIRDKAADYPVARVVYSRPQKAGRTVFGELVEYGKVWRMGANEATEFELYQNVKIEGKKVQKGRYTLYAIVEKDKWTIIINKETDTWGAFKYDAKKDVLRTDVPVQKTIEAIESLSMVFEKTFTGANLVVAWDNIKVSIPMTF
jgi:Protein of unknown function (DUF2911)